MRSAYLALAVVCSMGVLLGPDQAVPWFGLGALGWIISAGMSPRKRSTDE